MDALLTGIFALAVAVVAGHYQLRSTRQASRAAKITTKATERKDDAAELAGLLHDALLEAAKQRRRADRATKRAAAAQRQLRELRDAQAKGH